MRFSVPAAVLAALLAGTIPARAQPAVDHLRIIAPAAPGGGWDQTARVMQQVLLQAGLARTASVENIPGAAGTIGLARFIGAERGNGNALMASGLIMLGGIVTHRSPVTLRDVTPIARLTGEYEVIVVPATSSFRSLDDLIAALRARPEAISWGGGSAGGSDQILAGLVADAAGVPPRRVNYIAFSGGGESLAAIVGGQVSVGVNGLAELAAQIEAGTVRVLGISSAERIAGVDAPTLREQGVNVVFENWRSVVAPPGLTRLDRERLAETVEAMARSAAWRDALARYRWIDRYLGGDAFAEFVDAEEARVQAILKELGTGADEASSAAARPYPLFVLTGLLVCGAGMLLPASSRLRRTRIPGRRAIDTHNVVQPRPWGSLALLAMAVTLQLVLAERAGFIVASTVLFWLTARAFDARHPLRDAVFAIGLSAGAYLLFARGLDLQLPAGVLAPWL